MNKSIQGNANGIVDQAKQTVANVASDAKAGVTSQLEQRIDHAKGIGVEKIETVSDALRGASEKLEGTGPLPQLAEKAAAGIENLAHYVENKNIGDLFRGIETFARREPALFLGGAVAVGIIAGRFLKSSSRRTAAASDSYETYGFEGNYGSEGDYDSESYLSADDLEDDWETSSREPFAFESESNGIGMSSPTPTTPTTSTYSSTPASPLDESASTGSSSTSDWGRTTQPQGSSFGAGSTKGSTEKLPATQGSIGGGTTGEASNNKSSR